MFIGEHTDGFVRVARRTCSRCRGRRSSSARGVDEATIRRIAELYVDAKAAIACWAMGLTQHKHAVATIQEIVEPHAPARQHRPPGAGLCPVRGHSNVQGDRTMGIYHLPRPAFLDALGEAFGFEPPRTPGVDTVDDDPRARATATSRAFVALGGNFLSAAPDTDAHDARARAHAR